MKRIVLCVVGMLTILLLASPVRAHEYYEAESGTATVVMHVTPDDDPIAGNESKIYFDIGSVDLTSNQYSITVSIRNPDGAEVTVPAKSTGQTVQASYTFPVVGTYQIELGLSPRNVELSAVSATQDIVVSRSIDHKDSKVSAITASIIGFGLSFCVLVGTLLVLKRKELAARIRNDPVNK